MNETKKQPYNIGANKYKREHRAWQLFVRRLNVDNAAAEGVKAPKIKRNYRARYKPL